MAAAVTEANPISTIKSTLWNAFFSVADKAKAAVNRILPQERRENLKQRLVLFTTNHPLLATLLLSQAAFSGIPLVLFVLLTVGVLVFSLVAALVVAVLGALLFTVFCVGFALIILLPTLFVTTFAGVGVWLWGWGAYHIVKWFGSADTEQVTKLSSRLTSSVLGGPINDKQHNVEDEKKPLSYKQDATDGGTPRPDKQNTNSHPQRSKKDSVDLQHAATKPVGDVKEANISDVTNVTGL